MSKFKTSQSAISLLVVFGIFIALNIVVGQLRLRKDLTEEKLYTLSEGTTELVGTLSRNITLKFYFSKSLEGLPIPLKQYAQRVSDLLYEYASHSKGRITLETYDPKPDSDEEEWAQRYGLAGQSMGLLGGPSLYMGLVAVAGTKEAAIPVFDPRAESELEYAITRLIDEVLRTKKNKIGVMSSLPVMGSSPETPPSPLGQPLQGSKPWMLISELKKQYEVSSVDMDVEEVPEDVQTLLVIHPKEPAQKMLFALDQFVLRGGRLVVFVDPLCITEQDDTKQFGGLFGAASDLNTLTKAWGFESNRRKVIADFKAASMVSFGAGGSQRSPAWLSLRGEAIGREEIITSSLDILMLPFSGSFSGKPKEGLMVTTLLQTSEETSEIDSFTAMNSSANYRNAQVKGKTPLALRLQGNFKTAFPDGPPKEDTEGDDEPKAPSTDRLVESEKDGIVVLVADVDMLYDRYMVRNLNFFGQTLTQPINDNLSFVLNMLEQLSGSKALIGLRSRGTFDRPFDRVNELERQAQQRWQEEQAQLTEKLQAAQARFNQFQTEKQQDQKLILSPAQKREIEKVKKERFEAQRHLREVRKNLRQDIETLGLQVKLVNMGLMPVVVALFGVVYGWCRRRRGIS
ncbi:MAG: hypothetical protein GKR87_12490 [Kiritimatiellae bacterium]|nr:hypothetical protein [Kiritimatiellia bacterium]